MSATRPKTRPMSPVLGWAALVLVGATVGLGLVLPKTAEQAEYSRLIAVHPPAAWVSYLAVGVAALAAITYLVTRRATADRVNTASLEVGALFTALTLATGSIWGRPTWGVWWRWEPRLTTEALLLAVLVGAIALRRALPPGGGRAVVTSMFSLATLGLLPIVHFSVEWWRSQHQRGTLLSPDPESNADNPYLAAMFLGFLAFSVLYAWMMVQRVRIEVLEEEADQAELGRALVERRAERDASPPAPEAVTSPPAPEAGLSPPAPEAVTTPPAPEAVTSPPAPEAVTSPPAPEAVTGPPAPEAVTTPPAPEKDPSGAAPGVA